MSTRVELNSTPTWPHPHPGASSSPHFTLDIAVAFALVVVAFALALDIVALSSIRLALGVLIHFVQRERCEGVTRAPSSCVVPASRTRAICTDEALRSPSRLPSPSLTCA